MKTYANQFKPWRKDEMVIRDHLYFEYKQAKDDIEELFKIDKRERGSIDQHRKFIPGNNVCNQYIFSDGEDEFNEDLAHIDEILKGTYL